MIWDNLPIIVSLNGDVEPFVLKVAPSLRFLIIRGEEVSVRPLVVVRPLSQ